MSPTQFHAKQHDHDQKPLKINKDPNFIHRLPPSPATGSSTQPPPPPPPPVIIYTHSPKVIHTHPQDFKALVQKLTGYTPPPEDTQPTQDQRRNEDQGNNMEDNESSSVVTEEHGSPQGNSCFVDGGVAVATPPYKVGRFDPYFNPAPVFHANTSFLCTQTQRLPFYNPESLLLNRNSFSSSSSSLRVQYPDI